MFVSSVIAIALALSFSQHVAASPLASIRIAPAQRVALAVGPEGGFLPFEIEKLAEAGFEPVSMGGRTLRVETACVALLAQLDLLRRIV